MAVKSVATTDASVKKLWYEKLFRDTEKELYTKRFMGESENSPIQVIRDLSKGPGDKEEFLLVPRLEGDFILGSSGLSVEGREQSIVEYGVELTLEEYKLGVRTKKGLDAKRPIYDIENTSRERLIMNNAEKLDQLWFNAAFNAPTKLVGPNGHNTAATLTSTDTLTPSFCRKLFYQAKYGFTVGAGRVLIPLRPIRISGKDYYILLVHGYAVYDMKENATYQQSVREAMERGDNNPLFGGAVAVIENIIIHDHENVPFALTGGTGGDVPYSKGILMGAQATLWAWGQNPEVVRKVHGYEEEIGYATKTICKTQKPVFNSADYGSVGVVVACSNLGA